MSGVGSTLLGDKTAEALLAMFQDANRQEIAAEEDVHRTLPFFGTALGLVIAAINYAATQLPAWDAMVGACPAGPGGLAGPAGVLACTWPVLLTAGCLLLASLMGVGVLGFLAAATRRQGYARVGPESALLSRADAFVAYHQRLGLAGADLDEAVLRDVRVQMLGDYAQAIPVNRERTLRRYRFRAWAVACLLVSLLAALAGTMLILVAVKSGFVVRVAA